MEYLLGGLAIGSVYALIGIGVVLVFRTTGVVNFGQGELVTIGAYAYAFATASITSPVLTLLIALLAGIAAGSVFFFVTHILLRGRDQLTLVAGTLALLTLIQGTARLTATDRPMRAEAWLFGDRTITIGHAVLQVNSLVIIAVTAITALLLYLWFTHTMIGKLMSAVAEDPIRSALSGIPVRTTLWLSWAGAGALAAVAGVLVSPSAGVFPTMGAHLFLAAVVGAVVGGFDSILGALAGGLIVGLLQTFGVATVGGAYRDVLVFGLLMLMLLVRPHGIFGSRQLRRV